VRRSTVQWFSNHPDASTVFHPHVGASLSLSRYKDGDHGVVYECSAMFLLFLERKSTPTVTQEREMPFLLFVCLFDLFFLVVLLFLLLLNCGMDLAHRLRAPLLAGPTPHVASAGGVLRPLRWELALVEFQRCLTLLGMQRGSQQPLQIGVRYAHVQRRHHEGAQSPVLTALPKRRR